jgi:hypothetical protein
MRGPAVEARRTCGGADSLLLFWNFVFEFKFKYAYKFEFGMQQNFPTDHVS